MSMLSSMCDKLRTTADEVERIKHNNADWLWRDGVTLMDAVRELRDAADTIDNLRGMCQDVQFENARLRDSLEESEHDESIAWDRVRKTEAENEQLRKVVDLCSEYIEDDRCEGCIVKHACYNGDIDDCFMRVRLINMMHDIGIEVDDINQNNFQSTEFLVDLTVAREVVE